MHVRGMIFIWPTPFSSLKQNIYFNYLYMYNIYIIKIHDDRMIFCVCHGYVCVLSKWLCERLIVQRHEHIKKYSVILSGPAQKKQLHIQFSTFCQGKIVISDTSNLKLKKVPCGHCFWLNTFHFSFC